MNKKLGCESCQRTDAPVKSTFRICYIRYTLVSYRRSGSILRNTADKAYLLGWNIPMHLPLISSRRWLSGLPQTAGVYPSGWLLGTYVQEVR